MSEAVARHLLVAAAARLRGRLDLAEDACRLALAQDPDSTDARVELARTLWPGRPYLEVLADLHAILRPQRYVEIGVAAGDSLALAHDCATAIGIDPAPSADPKTGAILWRETAQAYFARSGLSADLGGRPFDMAFIDGAHAFRNVLADFLALAAQAEAHSLIVLHDCLPLDALSASAERRTAFWTGDGWKFVALLSQTWPQLRWATLMCPPSGLVLVSGFGAILQRPDEARIAAFGALSYEDFTVYRETFRLCPSDTSSLTEALRALGLGR